MWKKILNSLLLFFIILFSGTLVITLINYFNIMGSKIVSIIRFILPLMAMFISSYRLGNMSDKKGYLEGLKLGSIIILIFMVMVFLLDTISWKSILYYLILLLASVMGSMIGINRKKLNT
jgi:putative membrane protein (TIGR04086 family)